MARCFFLYIFAIFVVFIDARNGYVSQLVKYQLSTSRSTSPNSIFNPYRVVKNDVEIVYKEVPPSSILLSVDLGLRSGFALYNSTGHLISFAHHRFDTLQNLKASVLVELSTLSKQYNLNHFVLEGDAVYRSIWTSAINQFAADYEKTAVIIYIDPAEWRDRLLISRERKSGKDAKCASRLISRQIMWRSGMEDHFYQGPMNTDAAEAILIGHFAVNDKLRWSSQHTQKESNSQITSEIKEVNILSQKQETIFSTPLIERFSNGNVVLPKRTNSS